MACMENKLRGCPQKCTRQELGRKHPLKHDKQRLNTYSYRRFPERKEECRGHSRLISLYENVTQSVLLSNEGWRGSKHRHIPPFCPLCLCPT